MKDLIERADALAAIALGDTVNQLQAKIRAIPRALAPASGVEALAALRARAEKAENWKDDPERNEAWCAGNDYALTRLCKVLGVDPDRVSWDGSDGSLDEEADALIWRILHAKGDEEGRSPAEAERDDALARLAAAEGRVAGLREALKPFKDMAGELFARNWNRSDVVIALDNPGEPHRLTFGDFLELHAALAAVTPPATEYERKVAQMKEDFPNGI